MVGPRQEHCFLRGLFLWRRAVPAAVLFGCCVCAVVCCSRLWLKFRCRPLSCIAVYIKSSRASDVRSTAVLLYHLCHCQIMPALCSPSTVASSSAYHSSPKRRVSGSFRNLYTGSPSSLPFLRAASHMLQR